MRKDKVNDQQIYGSVYGKVPPQARDLEDAILGAILLESEALTAAMRFLKPESFYVENNQRIFRAMMALDNRREPIDILTTIEQLKRTEEIDKVGGPYSVTKLTNEVVSSAHIEAHCKIVAQKFMQRELIRVSGEVIQAAYEDAANVDELIDKGESDFLAIRAGTLDKDMISIDAALVETIQRIEEWRLQDSNITGVISGFKKLDNLTRGWQPKNLIIVAARPSVGKTAFVLQLLRNATADGTTAAAMFSLEMDRIQLVLRMLAAESKTVLAKLQTGRLEKQDMDNLYKQGITKLSRRQIYFDDSDGITLTTLRAKCRRLKNKHPNLKLILIDYLQLLEAEGKHGNREQEISNISRGLKRLTRELNIPIIALSQLGRDAEGREPQMRDLRESGAIEQDADLILLLWKPTDAEVKEDQNKYNHMIHAKVAKQRDGMLDKIDLTFDRAIQNITEVLDIKAGFVPVKTDLTEKPEDLPF